MEDNKDVAAEGTTPEEGGKDELDSILEALDNGDKPEDGGKTAEGDAPKDYFKKVGNHVFKSEAEYDAWAQKNYGEVSRLSGEMKKLQDKLTSKDVSPEARKETEQDIDALRMRIKAIDFFEDNPEALNYKEEMAAFLRTGKANDEKGRPSLDIAYKKALKADGKDVETSRASDEEKTAVKKVMQAGGGESGRLSDNPYQSSDDLKSIDSFADSALAGRF